MTARRSVLMVGLDAADADVVDRLVESGGMPNLARLRREGTRGRLDTPAGLYAGGVWPTFYTASGVSSHGVYHNKLWRPEAMRVQVAADDWIPARPFWEALPDPGPRVCIVDVPMVLGRPRPVDGVYVAGWGTHDVVGRGAWPPELWRELEGKFGRPVMPPELFGRQTERSLGRLGERLSAATAQVTALALDLLAREPWDLACVVLGATHRAGHYLWDRSQLGEGAAPGPAPDLLAVYRDVDAALGRLVAAVPDETLVLVFALHGMGPNAGWSDLLPDLLAALDEHATGAPPDRGLLYRLRRRVPFHWVRPLLTALPAAATDRLVSLWSRNMFDWSVTRSFPLPMDQAGYLRVNLRGRERDGVVEPGPEYEALLHHLEARLLGLRDAASDQPLVDEADGAVRASAGAPASAPARGLLPDLVVPWSGPRATGTRRVVSDGLPGFRWDVPATLPSGRAGNHTARAWFVARGPGVAGGRVPGGSIVDLVPTALRHLGLPPPPGLDGAPLDLAGGAPRARRETGPGPGRGAGHGTRPA